MFYSTQELYHSNNAMTAITRKIILLNYTEKRWIWLNESL